jgi:hypothetical protein
MNRHATEGDLSTRYYELSVARVGVPALPAF